MSALMTALVTAAAAGVATLAHEATHAVAGLLLGRFKTFDVLSWEVLYHIRQPPGWKAYAIAGAPLYVGLLLTPLALVVDVTLPIVIGWAIYTFLGAATNDFQFQTVETA
jgi:hypothetical protein